MRRTKRKDADSILKPEVNLSGYKYNSSSNEREIADMNTRAREMHMSYGKLAAGITESQYVNTEKKANFWWNH